MNGLLHKSYCRLAGFISLAKHSISLNEAKAIRDNVAFFQTIRAALVNSSGAEQINATNADKTPIPETGFLRPT